MFASLALLGANLGELAVPYYVGLIVDQITADNMPGVYERVGEIAIIVVVK